METIKIKCPKGKKIEIEKKISTFVECKDVCPLMKMRKCSKKSFNYTEILSNLVNVDFSFVNDGVQSLETPVVTPIIKEEKIESKNDIPFDNFLDFLGDNIQPTNDVVVEPINNQSKSILDKYNNRYGVKSIFDGIEKPALHEPCFKDGIYIFYEKPKLGSSGGVKDAIKYIFSHWLTYYVFNNDEVSLTKEMLVLLKLQGLTKEESKIKEIVESREYTINQKFFHLFYDVIYQGKSLSFYWSDEPIPFHKLLPRFKDRNEFLNKLAEQPGFFDSLENCFGEILLFLQKNKESFFEDVTVELAKKTGRICFFTDNQGKIKLHSLGDIDDFVDNIFDVDTRDKLYLKCEFFKKFQLTKNKDIVPRTNEFEFSKAVKTEDDSLYRAIGFSYTSSSTCATLYNYYVSIIREYINEFHPKKVNINGNCFSKDDFYEECKAILITACKTLTSRALNKKPGNFYLLKSLIERGVLDYYVETCETTKLIDLKKTILLDQINLEDYFALDIEHIFSTDKGDKNIKEYIEASLACDGVNVKFDDDIIIQAYFKKYLDESYLKKDIKQLDTLLNKNSNLINKYMKVGA